MTAFLLPEPTYSGPDNVIYFRGMNGLEEELNRDKKVVWLVTFYTVWNPACVNFAPIFAELSVKYHLNNFKFGKVDIGRYPDAAKKYRINDSSLSKQLPTIILFKDGQEVLRRPTVDPKLKVAKFLFTEENVRGAFDVKNIYDNCKTQAKNKKAIDHVKSD